LDKRGVSGYLGVFGLLLMFTGVAVGVLSVNMLKWADSNLASSAIILLVGAILAMIGLGLLLVSFLSTKNRTRRYYY
jgi:hypothetical protein